MVMPRRLIQHFIFASTLALPLAAFHSAAAAEIWYYTLGEERVNQQGNFCSSRGDIVEIANIFRKYGVRPGFSALSSSPNCEMRVDTFTPLEIIEEIDIVTRGAEHEYTISFLRVEVIGGGDSFLITTREVRLAK